MLKKGQIKFSKKAAIIAQQYLIKKNITEFLDVIESRQTKPMGSKDLCSCLFGVKQDSSIKCKIYTTNTAKSKKLFNHLLLKEGRLSVINLTSYGNALYILKSQEDKFSKIKKAEQPWPVVEVNDQDRSCLAEFTRKMDKATAVDLSAIILEMKSKKQSESSSVKLATDVPEKTINLAPIYSFFDVAEKGLNDWTKYFKELKR